MEQQDAITFMRQAVAAGDHWYLALLKTMARWGPAEETLDGRRYRYLIGGEAFDLLLLAERLSDELDGTLSTSEREALLFHGHPPLQLEEEEFQTLLGTPKYQAYLNFLYGVTVEEALQQAVEEEVAKERHSYIWANDDEHGERSVFCRIYGREQKDLLREFQKERGLEALDELQLTDLKEFTYWLFKYRIKSQDGARVASDTRKGLAALSRVEAALRSRGQEPDETEAAPPQRRSPAPRRSRRPDPVDER